VEQYLKHDSQLNNRGYSTPEDNLQEPRHRWYFYKEGFSNQLVTHAIEESNLKKDDIILDPFGGSGTVNLCASQKGVKSVGIEVNPFASFLSKTKQINASKLYLKENIDRDFDLILKGIRRRKKSPLLNFSTFSEFSEKEKWLFNSDVLNSFEGGYSQIKNINQTYASLFKLMLINSAMDNCNAKKDGKCLRYINNWQQENFNQDGFIQSFIQHFSIINEDLRSSALNTSAHIYNSDSRKFLQKSNSIFKLCITSPPYLNSFDYTDVYRPELYLGKFISPAENLIDLRKKTLSSHTNVYLKASNFKSSSLLYNKIISDLNANKELFWNSKLVLMVQSYFEQMEGVIKRLHELGEKNSELWIIVANSAYFNFEIPTDLILGDIATRVGWKLKDIHVLREIFKRGSKYSPDVNSLRESVVIVKK